MKAKLKENSFCSTSQNLAVIFDSFGQIASIPINDMKSLQYLFYPLQLIIQNLG